MENHYFYRYKKINGSETIVFIAPKLGDEILVEKEVSSPNLCLEGSIWGRFGQLLGFRVQRLVLNLWVG